jgi:hypothetical protein
VDDFNAKYTGGGGRHEGYVHWARAFAYFDFETRRLCFAYHVGIGNFELGFFKVAPVIGKQIKNEQFQFGRPEHTEGQMGKLFQKELF